MLYILYSAGQLRLNFDRQEALRQLSILTIRTEKEIQQKLLNGSRKKIKSSDSLEELFELKCKLEACGLDVYIETDGQ